MTQNFENHATFFTCTSTISIRSSHCRFEKPNNNRNIKICYCGNISGFPNISRCTTINKSKPNRRRYGRTKRVHVLLGRVISVFRLFLYQELQPNYNT